jgi:hypothetical protein
MEPELPSSAASKFADAARELIRAEMARPERLPGITRPAWREVVWVTILVVDVALLVSQVPEAVLKNASFEFAAKIVGSIFGGTLLLYSSWVRERLIKLCAVRWFQATLLILLLVLIFAQFATFSIQPVLPPDTSLFIDDGATPVPLRRGQPLLLTLRAHTVKVLPREGQEKLPGGEEVHGYEFTITPKDLLWHKYRGSAASWSPLYPVYVKCRFPGSEWELTTYGEPLPENLADTAFQEVPGTELVGAGTLRVRLPKDHPAATVWVPVGKYRIHERRTDGSVYCDQGVTVEQKLNSLDLAEQPCLGSQ